jgi:HAD superfamily hydrolase (TIGR01549 family)
MIKGITFDFGGTLAMGDLDKEEYRMRILEYFRSLGFRGGEPQFERARRGMLRRLMKARSLNREIRIEDLYQGMLFKLGLHPEREVVDHIHDLYIRSFKVDLVPSAVDVLESLNKKYTLAVISNAMSDAPRRAIKRTGLERYLKAVVISRDLGIRKPDREIFRFTLNNLGMEGHEVAHVGDSLGDDVQGAKNAGMRAIWIESPSREINVQPDRIIRSIEELTALL